MDRLTIDARLEALQRCIHHRYSDIDWAIVHHITHEGLEDFRAFVSAVIQVLDQ